MRVERSPFLDEYAEDGESVVLLPDGRVIALSPLASFVLAELAGGPLDAATLAQKLVANFGSPPSDTLGLITTKSVLETLAQTGVASLTAG